MSARLVRLIRLVHLVRQLAVLTLLLTLACSRPDPNTVRLPENQLAKRGDDPPVAVNPTSPVQYPPALFARGIEGNVILRLHIDETGHISQESTKVAESSGYPALDSAALAAVPLFRFAPALRNGTPVAATFMQPVHFRHPQAGGTTP
jgi:protein TonB